MPDRILLTRLPSLASRLPLLELRARILAGFGTAIVSAAAMMLCVFGCTQASRLNLATTTGGDAALWGQFRAYDGNTGQPLTFRQVVRRCATADVILFGEEHSDAVCNQFEAQLLSTLADRPRPVTLAMEFFETDTQAALDEYLDGQIDEPAFRKATRQGRAYVLAHRPLIEMCRAACIPVIAANAPRRLVHEYRKSDLDYCDFLAGLDSADQRCLPPQNEYLTGAYHERFIETMSQHGEPSPTPATAPGSPVMPPGAPAMPPGPPPMPAEPSIPPTAPSTPPSVPPASTSAPAFSPAARPAEDLTMLLAKLAAASNRLAQAASEVSEILEQLGTTTQPAVTGITGGTEQTATTATQPGMPTTTPTVPIAEPAGSQPAGMMAEEMDPEAFYRAQLLWDETMADSIADFRARCPSSRVMLIVGSFHVANDGGTAQKLRCRRPADKVVTLVYSGTTDGQFAFDPDDCNAGNIVIYGIQPPPEPKNGRPPGMPPMPRPATAPASPVTSPTTTSATMPADATPPSVPRQTEDPPKP